MARNSLNARTVPGMTFLGLLLLLVLCLPQLAMGNTYPVTSSQCSGPGSIVEAMGLANANPGTDTISIAAGLTIDAGTCPHPPGRFDDVNFVILEARESTVIEGNGATIRGHIGWVTREGIITPLTACPSERRGDIVTSLTPGLINVGQKDQDNSAITVTIRNLTLRELDAVANIFRNASLVVEDSTFFRIISSATPGCQRNAVDARDGANFTARRTRWEEIVNFNQVIATITNPSISGYRAGNLVIEESQFRLMFRAGAVNWWAQPGGTANIVSSVFDVSGAMVANGDTLTNIVNTVWAASPIGDPAAQDRFLNVASQPMNFVGSTVLYPDVVYPSYCDTQPNGEDCYGWILRDSRSNAGPINFFGSAIGVNFPDIPGPGKLLEGLPTGAPSGFSADAYTWIQPTPQQPAAALKSITNQPNLLTDAPGLPTASPWIPDWATPLEGTPAAPGLLVDAIDNALCGQVNALRNPVDGSCLTRDAYGNPRVDGNGRRSIGAVQVSLAPRLEVSRVGDQVVDLKWSRPQNPASGAVTGYEIRYCETGTLTCSTSTIAGAATLTASLTGLTNGVSYDFRVVPLIGAVPGAQPSNTVNATPVGLIGTPVVTAVAGDAQVSLSWTTPAGNGHVLGRYTVLWRPVGSATFGGGRIVNAPSTNTVISGLINGTTYEFLVAANSSDGTTGPQGSATATPQAAPTLNYANPSNWPQNTPLILDPSFGQLLGTATYSLPSGTLPTGVGLNPATGIISGTPTVLGETTSATIRLTDGATGLYAETTVALNIVAPSANPQLSYPAIQATVGVGPVGSIPTQSGIPAGAVWSVYPGDSLPGGFTLNPATGVISGTPTTAPGQVVDITIQACWGGCDPNAGEVRLAPMIFWIVPRLQYPAVTVATAGVPETITPTVDPWSGGQFSIASGSLPDGMTLNPATGVISGTPQSGQDHSVTVRYSTGVNVLEPPLEFVYSTARINVDWPAITLTYPDATAFVGTSFSVLPTVTGLTGTAVYSLYSGSLPQGLSLNPATGAITGVPTGTPGSYPVVIEVTGPYGSQREGLTISLQLPVSVTPVPTLSPPAPVLLAILMMLSAWGAIRLTVGHRSGRSA